MKKGLLALGTLFAICLSLLATDMVVKQKNGEDWKINVDDVEEVFFEENAIIPEDSTVVDASETFLLFNILSDSTAELTRDDSGDELSYYGHDSITIPPKVRIDGNVYTVTSIGERAFEFNNKLKSVNIPEGVTSIGARAFYGCFRLASIDIPESVTSIGDLAFSRCKSLASIDIPENVTSIGDNAFESCSSLTSIKIPEEVTSIGYWAFYGCDNLEPKLLIYDKGTKCYGWVGDKKKCTDVLIP